MAMNPGEEDGYTSVLEIDESLSLLERVKYYSQSAVAVQRLVHVQELGACAEEIGPAAALSELVPLLKDVSCDAELSVRQALAEQLVPLCAVLMKAPEESAEVEGEETSAHAVVVETCVPLLSAMLTAGGGQELAGGGSAQLIDAAAEALVAIAALLPADEVGTTVLTAVLTLAHDPRSGIRIHVSQPAPERTRIPP